MKQLSKKTICIFLTVLMLSLTLVSCLQSDDQRPAVTLADHNLSVDMVRRVVYHTVSQLSEEGSLFIEGQVNGELLMNQVKQTLSDQLMVHFAAQDLEVSLSSADRREIRSSIRDLQREYGTREDFLYEIAKFGLSEQAVFDWMYIEELQDRLYPIIFTWMLNLSSEDILDDILENFVSTTHIFVSGSSRTSAEVAEEADRLYALIADGEDMAQLAARYSDDAMSVNNTFTDGSTRIFLFFSQAAQALAVDEIAKVETALGVYLIRRNEITRDHAEALFSDLYLESNSRMFRDTLREIAGKSEVEVVFTEIFYEIFEEIMDTHLEGSG